MLMAGILMEEEKNTKSDKRQTELLIGVALLILGVIFACFALMQPKIDSADKNMSSSDNANSSESVVNSQDYSQNENYSQNSTYVNNQNYSKQSSVKKEKSTKPSLNVLYPLNLNTCTSEELQTIDNIGKTRAEAIIAYRNYLGGYTSVEQLKEISGIGDTIFNSIAPYVTV